MLIKHFREELCSLVVDPPSGTNIVLDSALEERLSKARELAICFFRCGLCVVVEGC